MAHKNVVDISGRFKDVSVYEEAMIFVVQFYSVKTMRHIRTGNSVCIDFQNQFLIVCEEYIL